MVTNNNDETIRIIKTNIGSGKKLNKRNKKRKSLK